MMIIVSSASCRAWPRPDLGLNASDPQEETGVKAERLPRGHVVAAGISDQPTIRSCLQASLFSSVKWGYQQDLHTGGREDPTPEDTEAHCLVPGTQLRVGESGCCLSLLGPHFKGEQMGGPEGLHVSRKQPSEREE